MDKNELIILVGMQVFPDENARDGFRLHGGVMVPELISPIYLAKEPGNKMADPRANFLHELANFSAALLAEAEIGLLDLVPHYGMSDKAACPWLINVHLPADIDLWREEIVHCEHAAELSPIHVAGHFGVDLFVLTSSYERDLESALSDHVICPMHGKQYACGAIAEDLVELITGIEQDALNGKGGA